MPNFTSLEDFRKYFHKTVAILHHNHSKKLVYVLEEGPGGDKGDVRLSVKWLTKNLQWRNDTFFCNYEDVECFVPAAGYVNLGPWPIWVGRQASKQWRRSYNGQSYHPQPIVGTRVKSGTMEMRSSMVEWSSPTLLKALVQREYPSYDDVISQLKHGEVFGSAFHKNYALVFAGGRIEKPLLYYKTYPVGWVDSYAIQVPDRLSEFSQALADYAPVEVVNNE